MFEASDLDFSHPSNSYLGSEIFKRGIGRLLLSRMSSVCFPTIKKICEGRSFLASDTIRKLVAALPGLDEDLLQLSCGVLSAEFRVLFSIYYEEILSFLNGLSDRHRAILRAKAEYRAQCLEAESWAKVVSKREYAKKRKAQKRRKELHKINRKCIRKQREAPK